MAWSVTEHEVGCHNSNVLQHQCGYLLSNCHPNLHGDIGITNQDSCATTTCVTNQLTTTDHFFAECSDLTRTHTPTHVRSWWICVKLMQSCSTCTHPFNIPLVCFHRVLGSLSNSDDFAAAFHCPSGGTYTPKHKCELW